MCVLRKFPFLKRGFDERKEKQEKESNTKKKNIKEKRVTPLKVPFFQRMSAIFIYIMLVYYILTYSIVISNRARGTNSKERRMLKN